jgi:tetratricopeptide (TPR) repeat protein
MQQRNVSFDAQLEYMRGRQLMATWINDDSETAITHFKQAIILDPNYAAAHAQLANALLHRANAGGRGAQWEAAKQEAAPLLERALELDPELGEAYIIRTVLKQTLGPDKEADLLMGLTLNPSYAYGYERLADLYMRTNRHTEAIEMIDKAITLDPLWPRFRHLKALMYLFQGDIDQARRLELEVLRLQPQYYWAQARLAQMALLRGDFAMAAAYAERAVASDPSNVLMRDLRIYCYLALGEGALAERLNKPESLTARLFLAQFLGDYSVVDDADLSSKTELFDLYTRPVLNDVLLRAALVAGEINRARRLLSGGGVPDSTQISALKSSLRTFSGSLLPLASIETTKYKAVAAAMLGNRGATLANLEQLQGAGSALWWWVLSHPAFHDLQNEPRFQALLATYIANVAEQRKLLVEMRSDQRIPDYS